MTDDYHIYNYKDTGYTFTHAPKNGATTIQVPLITPTVIYYISGDNTKQLWKYDIATHTDAQIDIDPTNASPDSKSRLHIIQSLYYDSTTNRLYGVDCDNDGTADAFYVWYISTLTDVCTEIGTSAGGAANSYYGNDIFKIGSDMLVSNYEYRFPSWYLVVWDVDASPFVKKAELIIG